ncbi:MAG: hypothetical protein IKO91_06750 [Oscillospiraceae bacterium]|nr:hypothetical protein [Oscillospiraceae bacterium]
MKTAKIVCFLCLVLVLLLAGCDGATFVFTGTPGKTTIQINDAADGAYAESSPISVGKGRVAVVESALDKGEVQIEFAEATIFRSNDDTEEIIVGDVIAMAKVSSRDKATLPLEKGDYVLLVTTVGSTGGKVTVSIEKE